MSEPNNINKIFIEDTLTVKPINTALFAFNSGKAMDKSTYSIVENYVNVTDEITAFLSVYYFTSSDNYYEYRINLSGTSTNISGKDRFSNTLTGLTENTVIIFVNGIKLNAGEYTINSDTSLTLYKQVTTVQFSTVTIHACSGADYMGKVTDSASWNETLQTFTIQDVTLSRYAFFLNGQIINRDYISFSSDGTVQFHITIRPGVDYLDYYRFAEGTVNLNFTADPGFFSYGPKDKYNIEVPFIYDALITFNQHIARLAVDNLRTGFFIREVDSNGCYMIIDNDFEKKTVKCLKIAAFEKTDLTATEYYLQVPDAKSILYYVSEFDLNNKLLPEILGTFQGLLLNETYDSIERIRNLRSLTKVDSKHINTLIEFLGFKLRLTNMNLEQKHELLEELNNFYKIVGTKASYNFYNVISKNSKIVDLQQLYTPIKDKSNVPDWLPNTSYTASKSTLVKNEGLYYYCTSSHVSGAQFDSTEKQYWERTSDTSTEKRYVTFYTAEELGAAYKRKYQFPYTDYGKIGQLANPTDILSNQPHKEGTPSSTARHLYSYCDNKWIPIICPNGEWNIYDNTEEGAVPLTRYITPNPYITDPVAGPNTPTADRGRLADFEYDIDLSGGYTLLEGEDMFGNQLEGLSTAESQIFIHGKKLNTDEYTIISPNMLLILGKYSEKELILLQARSFTTTTSTTGYASYYYTNGDNYEDDVVYTEEGKAAYGLGNYKNYPILWKLSGENTIFYHSISGVEVNIGTGMRNGLLDKYVHTSNIEKPYSKVLQAYTGDILTEQEIEVSDYSYTLDRGDVQLNGYIGAKTSVRIPNTSSHNTSWYINLEDIDSTIPATVSTTAYKVYDSEGNRIYDTNLNTPIIGILNLNSEGTASDITFISKVGSTTTTYGQATRNTLLDVKTENTKQTTRVVIYKSSMTPTNIYDLGYVYETIKGEWIEWFEWDRPSNWYPTNHVDISLEVPADVDYDTFVNEFKKSFYDIASTVLYIHSIINVYTFGYNKNGFGMMSAPSYQTYEYTLTNNPQIQPPIPT